MKLKGIVQFNLTLGSPFSTSSAPLLSMTPLSMISLVIFLQSMSCPADLKRFLELTNLAPSLRTSSSHLFLGFPTCLLPPRLPSILFGGGGGFCCRTFLLHFQPTVIFRHARA